MFLRLLFLMMFVALSSCAAAARPQAMIGRQVLRSELQLNPPEDRSMTCPHSMRDITPAEARIEWSELMSRTFHWPTGTIGGWNRENRMAFALALSIAERTQDPEVVHDALRIVEAHSGSYCPDQSLEVRRILRCQVARLAPFCDDGDLMHRVHWNLYNAGCEDGWYQP